MSTTPNIQITADQKFEQAKQIYVIAEQFSDAIVVLQGICGPYLKSQQMSWEVSLNWKIIIPLTSDSIVNITTAVKILSPVSGIKDVHHHKESKRKQEILWTKSSTLSPGEELILQHVNDSQHNTQKDNRTPAPKRECKSCACISLTENRVSVKLPNPKSGKGYNMVEILKIVLNVPRDSGCLQFAMIKEIEYHQKQHNTPCCSRTIYCLLEKHAKGSINIFGECKEKGRPQLCSDDDIKGILSLIMGVQSWENI
jgi:hypothetical protein